MDWSYDLLNDEEKALLCRLSVFADGWTLQAAAEVCTEESLAGGEAFVAWETLDLLTSLADKSLVMAASEASQTRYRLLETVRQYARDRLAESGNDGRWRAAHCHYFLRMAEEAAGKLKGPDQVLWLQRLETEHDNLRAALDFCLNASEGATIGIAVGREFAAVLVDTRTLERRPKPPGSSVEPAGSAGSDRSARPRVAWGGIVSLDAGRLCFRAFFL